MTAASSHDVDQRLSSIGATPFDQLSRDITIRAYGVEYAHVRTAEGGDLFVTRYGWPFLAQLMPENWYADKRYAQIGQKLPHSTGTVYRVPTNPIHHRSIDIVVKFSRVGQEVPLEVASAFPDHVSPQEIANARFNGPLEEFGLVEEMRAGNFGPKDVRLMAHHPLAIYAPPEQFEIWQLGRSRSSFSAYQQRLSEDQNPRLAIELDIKRDYVLLYSWIKGHNAEEAMIADEIAEAEVRELTLRVIDELHMKGFRVLDNKPKHFIVRRNQRTNEMLRFRDGRLMYGLVDFELLQRTSEYQRHYKSVQRARYWELQSHRLPSAGDGSLPPHLRRMKIFGVNYIYGTAPNGGKVWTVGTDPDLFDYFLPDRWRRTPRVKLALNNEVYRTRTRDNIHVVYRRSRVGERPHTDPFYEYGRRVREHGYNSPFEEVAIAEHLRAAGLSSTYPRAIYRTGHESTKVGYIRDPGRYRTHADIVTPEPECEPVLSPYYDYYTISGYFRGIDPQKHYRQHGHWGFIDLEKAREDRLLTDAQAAQVLDLTRRRLRAIHFPDEMLAEFEFLLCFGDDGTLRRDAKGEFEVTWCLDSLNAHDYELISEPFYRYVIERSNERLQEIGCDALSFSGGHLLLSMNPDGDLRTDDNGEPEVTLSNFELLRILQCPLPTTHA
jgi:hypothetical protein